MLGCWFYSHQLVQGVLTGSCLTTGLQQTRCPSVSEKDICWWNQGRHWGGPNPWLFWKVWKDRMRWHNVGTQYCKEERILLCDLRWPRHCWQNRWYVLFVCTNLHLKAKFDEWNRSNLCFLFPLQPRNTTQSTHTIVRLEKHFLNRKWMLYPVTGVSMVTSDLYETACAFLKKNYDEYSVSINSCYSRQEWRIWKLYGKRW